MSFLLSFMKLNVLSFRTMEQPECIENEFEESHSSKLIRKFAIFDLGETGKL
jgi:hypothetical protein